MGKDTQEIKKLEEEILNLKQDIKKIDSKILNKKKLLAELECNLRHLVLRQKTANVSTGDSLFFLNKDGIEIETMLIADSRDYLDLLFLTDCRDLSDSISRGKILGKKYVYLDSLIKDVEDFEGLNFIRCELKRL